MTSPLSLESTKNKTRIKRMTEWKRKPFAAGKIALLFFFCLTSFLSKAIGEREGVNFPTKPNTKRVPRGKTTHKWNNPRDQPGLYIPTHARCPALSWQTQKAKRVYEMSARPCLERLFSRKALGRANRRNPQGEFGQ